MGIVLCSGREMKRTAALLLLAGLAAHTIPFPNSIHESVVVIYLYGLMNRLKQH